MSIKENNVIISISKNNSSSTPIGAYLRYIEGARESGCNNLEEQSILGCNQIIFNEEGKVCKSSRGAGTNPAIVTTHFTADLNRDHYILVTADFGDMGAIDLVDNELKINNFRQADFDYNEVKDFTEIKYDDNKKGIWSIELRDNVVNSLIHNDVLVFYDVNAQIQKIEDLYFGVDKEFRLDHISTKYTVNIFNKETGKTYYLVFIDNKKES